MPIIQTNITTVLMKKILFLMIGAAFFAACKNDGNEGGVRELQGGDGPNASLIRNPATADMPMDTNQLARMAASRQQVLTELRSLSAADFYRVRQLDAYDVTPEWVLYHLLEHEAGHRGEIGELRRQAERARM